MTAPIRLTPRVLSQTAAELEKDAADMEARAMQLEEEQQQDGAYLTRNFLQTALFTAAKNARHTADTYRAAALYAEALATMQAAPVCPAEYAIFDAATLEQAEGLYVWRGTDPIPSGGQRVKVTMNGLGFGTVAGYFLAGEAGKADPARPERRFLGVGVLLEGPPDWYKAQHPNWQTEPARVFGPEVAALE
ncbi:hypothetical protein Dxin01_03897 [Deinococcus xinjiangensis]|uniref:Uncharacterized protein n=1 Tax=Deinococcus xinjiangensis TaxID=457454 RepID=A0ABP9VL61_9DEIO